MKSERKKRKKIKYIPKAKKSNSGISHPLRMKEITEAMKISHIDPLDKIYKKLNIEDVVKQPYKDTYPLRLFMDFLKFKNLPW